MHRTGMSGAPADRNVCSTLEVLFAPAEFIALRERDLSRTVCVVFDVLRSTSTMMTALDNGAARIIPVSEIEEALAIQRLTPHVLLAGERDGVRIRAHQTGGTDFDLGNSPREFTADAVRGKTIVITTTNGTRALRACAPASAILIGSFLGLSAVADWVRAYRPPNLLLIGAGTINQASYEDTLAAGALADLLWPLYESWQISDSAAMARQLFLHAAGDLPQAMKSARNGRRLLANPELREDVAFCLRRDTLRFVAQLTSEGVVGPLTAVA
jgi:2-phosphosulfolactate phosphatase